MYKYFNYSEIVPQCSTVKEKVGIYFKGYGANSLGIKGKKGPKQAFLKFLDNNLCLTVWISLTLYHTIPYNEGKD